MTIHSLKLQLATNKWLIALLACFLLTHPYAGIWHDAVLYTAQALQRIHPEHFKNDLFFTFGSQDDLSIYSTPYGILIDRIGIKYANYLCLFTFQVAWLSAAWRLGKNLLPAPWHWIGLLLVTLMPKHYGSHSIFSYNEIFLTARLPAEAFGLWSIAMVLEQRKYLALFLTTIATLCHPLIGSITTGIVIMQVFPCKYWWSVAVATLLVITATQLWPNIFKHPQILDPLWLTLSHGKSPFIFVSLWSLEAWSKTCWIIALPYMAWLSGSPKQHRFWGEVFLLGTAGMVLALIADTIGQDALLIQIQSWRVLWLLSVLQWFAACDLILRLWPSRKIILGLLAFLWPFASTGSGFVILAWAALIHFFRTFGISIRFSDTADKYKKHVIFLLTGTLVLAYGFWLATGMLFIPTAGGVLPQETVYTLKWLEELIHTDLALILVIIISALCWKKHRVAEFFLTVLLIFLLTYGIINMDGRGILERHLEATFDHPELTPFFGIVKSGDMVHWQGDVRFPWLTMTTSNYFSRQQSAGIIFNRNTAIEAMRRSARIQGKSIPSELLKPHANLDNFTYFTALTESRLSDTLSRKQLLFLCHDPILDFAILDSHYPEWSIAEYKPSSYRIQRWLYDCRSLRKSHPEPSGT